MSQRTIYANDRRWPGGLFPDLTIIQAHLTRIGMCLSAGGWLVLSLSIGARLLGHDGRAIDWLALLILALGLIISGAAIMIVDALHQGFGALDRFFQAALERSAKRAPDEVKPATPAQPASSVRVRERGVIDDRPYVIYDDGVVAVETLLGVRLFNSLIEAQEFICG